MRASHRRPRARPRPEAPAPAKVPLLCAPHNLHTCCHQATQLTPCRRTPHIGYACTKLTTDAGPDRVDLACAGRKLPVAKLAEDAHPAAAGNAECTVLCAKVMTNSDASSGRIILPRIYVEANLSFVIGYRCLLTTLASTQLAAICGRPRRGVAVRFPLPPLALNSCKLPTDVHMLQGPFSEPWESPLLQGLLADGDRCARPQLRVRHQVVGQRHGAPPRVRAGAGGALHQGALPRRRRRRRRLHQRLRQPDHPRQHPRGGQTVWNAAAPATCCRAVCPGPQQQSTTLQQT